MGDQTTKLTIGSTYTFRGKQATIKDIKGDRIYYQGSGFGGSASEGYFRSLMPTAPTSTAQLPEVKTHDKVVIPKKTLNVSAAGSGAEPTRAEYKDMWLAGTITTAQFQKTLVGIPISKTATSNATAPGVEPHKDTSLLKLTKKGSNKFYVIVCIVLGIIIFAEGKIFKKVVK
jgi:hypothetical protein